MKEVIRRAKLSVSVIKLSKLIGARRVDAEAYRPEMLNVYMAIAHLPFVQLGSKVAFVTDGQHGYHEIDEDSDIKHLTAQCIKNGYIDASNADRISADMHARNQRSACAVGDVLLSTAGTIGNAGVVTADVLPANMDQDVARIKIHDRKALNPWYVAAFLNSRFGRLQAERESTGQVQQHLALEKVRQLRIPLLKERDSIAKQSQESFELFRKSEDLYAQAQALLSTELGLDKLDLSDSLYSVQQVSEAKQVGRIDAEYFQLKYQRVIEALGRSGKCIEDVAEVANRRFKPYVGEPFDYIEIGDLTGAGVAESTKLMGEEAPSRAQWIVKAGDVITSTVRPIRRLSALIEAEQDDFVCSSGFVVLKPKSVEPELLLLYLRLPTVCEILDLYTTASMYPAISASDLLNIPITLSERKSLREELVAKVKASRQARQDAQRLLAEAKAEVERLIEGK